MREFKVDKCRSCGADIFFVTMESGRSMPLDAEPCDDGNVIVDNSGRGHVMDGGHWTPRFKSHFATCPEAKRWRKKGEGRE